MKLLTHNMLPCNIKEATNGFLLRRESEKWVQNELDFLRSVFPNINWRRALIDADASIPLPHDPPISKPIPNLLLHEDQL